MLRSVGYLPITSQPDRHPSQAGFLVLGSAASASFESLLEIQTLRPYPTRTDSASAFYQDLPVLDVRNISLRSTELSPKVFF